MNEAQKEIADKIKNYLSETLNIPPELFDYDTPLFGDGIGLDSVDSLEVIAGMDTLFGVSLISVNDSIMRNIRTLSEYIYTQITLKDI